MGTLLKRNRNWFMTPTMDYYTVIPLTATRAKELVDLGVHRIIIPDETYIDSEIRTALLHAQVEVTVRSTKEMSLTGS